MRKIESLEKREKRDIRNRRLMGVILILLMGSSIIGFAFAFYGAGFSSDNPIGGSETRLAESKFTYNGFDFILSNSGLFQFQTNYGIPATSIDPREIEDVEFNIDVNVGTFFNKPLYYVYKKETLGLTIIDADIGLLAFTRKRACIDGVECWDENFPAQDCTSNVIVMKLSEEIKAYKEGNCIFLEGSDEEILTLANKLVYKVFGVQ